MATVGPQRWTLVVGMHRSGTSAAAAVLSALVGDELEPDPMPSNPYGQWERLELRPHLDALLLRRGATWDHPPADDATWRLPAAVRRPLARALHRAGPGERVWKDPRLSLTMPVWLELIDQPRLAMVVRHPSQVARSLETRNGTPLAVGHALWDRYVRTAIAALNGREVFVVPHRSLVGDPPTVIDQLSDWVGGASDERRATARSRVVVGSADVPTEGHLPENIERLWSFVDRVAGVTTFDPRELPVAGPLADLGKPSPGRLVTTGARTIARLAS